MKKWMPFVRGRPTSTRRPGRDRLLCVSKGDLMDWRSAWCNNILEFVTLKVGRVSHARECWTRRLIIINNNNINNDGNYIVSKESASLSVCLLLITSFSRTTGVLDRVTRGRPQIYFRQVMNGIYTPKPNTMICKWGMWCFTSHLILNCWLSHTYFSWSSNNATRYWQWQMRLEPISYLRTHLLLPQSKCTIK